MEYLRERSGFGLVRRGALQGQGRYAPRRALAALPAGRKTRTSRNGCLGAAHAQVCHRLAQIRADDSDLESGPHIHTVAGGSARNHRGPCAAHHGMSPGHLLRRRPERAPALLRRRPRTLRPAIRHGPPLVDRIEPSRVACTWSICTTRKRGGSSCRPVRWPSTPSGAFPTIRRTRPIRAPPAPMPRSGPRCVPSPRR